MAFSIKPPDPAVAAAFPGPYENGYRTAQLLIATGKVFMYWISWIYGLFHLLIALPPGGPGGFYHPYGTSFRMFIAQVVPGLYSVVYTWALGLLLVGIGHILTAILDTASSSSPPPPPRYASPV